MRMLCRTLLAGVLISLLISVRAFAANVYVGEVHSQDGDQQLAQTLRTLLGTSVATAGGSLAENANQADYSLNADILKLGPAFILTVSRVKAGQIQFTTRQKANSIEELDVTSDHAVRAAMLGVPTQKDTRVGEVTHKQAQEMVTRIQSKNSTYLGFGPAGLVNMDTSKIAYDFALGYNWGVAPNWDVKVLADGVFSSDWKSSVGLGTLGLNFYFSDTDITPYFTAGFGFGLSASTDSHVTTVGGFASDVGVGIQMFRLSSTQFDIALTYGAIFANNTIGSPGFTSLRIGVLF